MGEFQTSYNRFLEQFSAMMFGHVCSVNDSIKFYGSQPYLVSHVTGTLKLEHLTFLPNKTNASS